MLICIENLFDSVTLTHAAQFFGESADAWLTIPPHFTKLPWIRGTLKYGDHCVAIVHGTEGLWSGGRRDYDPDLWVMAP